MIGLDFKLPPEEQITAAAAGQTRIKWDERIAGHVNDADNKVKELIYDGIVQGQSYSDVAKGIKERFDITASKAETIARTESHRAREMGSMAATIEAAEMGINMMRRWLATLDGRTRDTHGAMDGQEIEVYDDNGEFAFFESPEGGSALYPGGFGIAGEDINCRCSTIDIVKGYEPTTRRARDEFGKGEVIPYTNFTEYAQSKGWVTPYAGAEPRVTVLTAFEQLAVKYSTPDQFMRENIAELKAAGIKSKKATEEAWRQAHYKNSGIGYKQIPLDDAVKVVNESLPANIRHGWFREADSAYKPALERAVITNPELRNAGMNIAHQNFIAETGQNISFNDFVRSQINVYRGGNMNFVTDDVFVSYSYSKDAALKFGKNIDIQQITPSNTLGSYQTTGEREILLPFELLTK